MRSYFWRLHKLIETGSAIVGEYNELISGEDIIFRRQRFHKYVKSVLKLRSTYTNDSSLTLLQLVIKSWISQFRNQMHGNILVHVRETASTSCARRNKLWPSVCTFLTHSLGRQHQRSFYVYHNVYHYVKQPPFSYSVFNMLLIFYFITLM